MAKIADQLQEIQTSGQLENTAKIVYQLQEIQINIGTVRKYGQNSQSVTGNASKLWDSYKIQVKQPVRYRKYKQTLGELEKNS